MQSAESEHATQGSAATPIPGRGDGHETRDGVFVIVDVEAQRAGEVVFDEFAEPGFTVHNSFWCADYVVAVWEEAGGISGRVGDYV